jgi:tetratricopeptide (TPR) repeat protein
LEDADLTAVAQHRRADPPKLLNLIRGDLDWIVMKSLEKDRTRRFETVNALGMDVQRHLDNEPVVARPPSQLYRFQKLVRRNRFAVTASAVVILLMVTVLSAWFSLLQHKKQARELAFAAKMTQQRLHAEAELYRLNYEAGEMPYKWSPSDDKAEPLYRKALELRRTLSGNFSLDTADALDHLAFVLNRPDQQTEVESIYRESLAIRKRLLGSEYPLVAASSEQLAHVLASLNKLAEAESLYREVVEIRRKHVNTEEDVQVVEMCVLLGRLASVLEDQGKLSEAESAYREA